jgi:hypothetical protein
MPWLARVAAAALVLTACSATDRTAVESSAPPTPTPAVSSAVRATSTTATTTTTTTLARSATSPPPTPSPISQPLRVGWVGGSEVVLRELSLPSLANELGLEVGGRALVFEPFTKTAASAVDTESLVSSALASGVEALIVTFNPQWLYGRVCDGVEPPHARYACLLADGPVVGAAAIDELVATIVESGAPAVVVLTPTSVDALESPDLAGLIALANDRLEQHVAAQSSIAVVDETLTAGREEYREGAGFYEMVHPTPAGAALLAQSIATTLVAEWCQAPCVPG